MNGLARQPVLIMAGGTGGHIFPGLAVAEVLRGRGIDVHWLGARGGMEGTEVAAHGIAMDEVRISGVRGKGILGWLLLPFRLLRALGDAWRSLRRVRPACAISFGGYAAGPGGLAAWLKGVPLVVHEQNRVPGMTNRFLARLAARVLQAFPGTFPESARAETCGNPVRSDVAALPEPRQRFQARAGAPRLLVTGGSQGASVLNRVVPAAVAALPLSLRPHIRHQAGRGAQASTLEAYRDQGVEAEVCEFVRDMAAAYGWADLVICRAGALTVSELAAAGLGAVLVPFPHAVDDHQTRNAEFLEQAGGARILPEAALSSDSLAAVLAALLADRGLLMDWAEASRAVGVRDAAQRVAAACTPWVAT